MYTLYIYVKIDLHCTFAALKIKTIGLDVYRWIYRAILHKEFIFFLRSLSAFCNHNTLRGDGAQGGAVAEHGGGSLRVLVSVVEPSSFDLMWREGGGRGGWGEGGEGGREGGGEGGEGERERREGGGREGEREGGMRRGRGEGGGRERGREGGEERRKVERV